MEATFDTDRVLLMTLLAHLLRHYLTLRTPRQRLAFLPLVERVLVALATAVNPPPRRIRTALGDRRPVSDFADQHFLPLFRFPRAAFLHLIRAYAIPATFSTGGFSRVRTNAWDAIGIVLRRLAYPARWFDLQYVFNTSEAALKAVFSYTLRHMFGNCKDRTQRLSRTFLTDDRLLRYCTAIRRKGGRFRRVFGFIDGICRGCLCRIALSDSCVIRFAHPSPPARLLAAVKPLAFMRRCTCGRHHLRALSTWWQARTAALHLHRV